MMTEIVTGLNDSRVARIKALLDQLWSEMPFFIKLTPDERQAETGVAEGRLPVVQVGAKHGKKFHTELGFPLAESERLTRMTYDFEEMSEILGLVLSFLEGLSDTTLKIGANCYHEVLVLKILAEAAIRRGIPGMEKVYDDLTQPFERHTKPHNGGTNGNPTDGPAVV